MPHSVRNSTSTTQTNMSRPSSTSTYSGNASAFPKQAGAALLSPEKVGEQLSPAASQFSFASSPHSPHEIDFESQQAADGIGPLRPVTSATSRSRAQFYQDQFAYKDGIVSTARERVTKDAPIVAELRTNVIVRLSTGIARTNAPLSAMLTPRRSKTNTPWSRTSRIISLRATNALKHPS
jgi:hypothetical protein